MALQLEEIQRYVAPGLTLDQIRNAPKPESSGDIAERIWQKRRQKAHNLVRADLQAGNPISWLPVEGWIKREGNYNIEKYYKIQQALFDRIQLEFKPLQAKFEEDDEDGMIGIDFSHLNPEKARALSRQSAYDFLRFMLGVTGFWIGMVLVSKRYFA